MKLRFPVIASTVFLTMSLSLMGSRTFAPVHSREFPKIKKDLDPIWQSLDYGSGVTSFREAADQAKKAGYVKDEVVFLQELAGCQFGLYQFQSALKTMIDAREMARQIGDRRILAMLGSNMSALYEQMDNLADAEIAAEEGAQYADLLELRQQALLYSQLGTIQAKREHMDLAEGSFAKAIEIAREDKKQSAEAWALDALAFARLEAKKLPEAEAAARKSLEIRKQPAVGGSDQSYMVLGAILAKSGDPKGGLAMLNSAEEALDKPLSLTPEWLIYMRRGEIKLQAHDWQGALDDSRKAVASAREWRIGIPANDVNRTSSEKRLAELYQLQVEAGNQLYLTNHNPALVRETFETAEENRAASLRALQDSDWRKELSPHYYELLAKLQALHAAQMHSGNSEISDQVRKLRSEMEQMEASAGATVHDQRMGALDQAQRVLDEKSVLLSFQLGETGSWMWAVTQRGISLYPLPDEKKVKAKVTAFQQAAGSNGKDLRKLSEELYRDLFGAVPPEILAHERWLLVLDGALFDLPFAALVADNGRFLVEDHSLQITPGALMLKSGGYGPPAQGGFLAVGDPIYNRADPRAGKEENGQRSWRQLISRVSFEQTPSLARLWGTAREIEVSARAWNAPKTELLTGSEVSPENFWQKTHNKPDIIHIATHVLEENEKPKTGWIAFSLGHDGQVQYVTPEDILANSISARLVVLSGCSSGKAEIQQATGLMGLTRAWIAAGAGAVLATRWPTVDDDGAFFESFYRNLKQEDPINPSQALRQATLEMLKSGSWRANPSFWAGYFLIGKY